MWLEIIPNFCFALQIKLIISGGVTALHEPKPIIVFALVNIQIDVVLDKEQAKLVKENIGCLDKSTNELILSKFYNFEVFEHKALDYRVNAKQVTIWHYLNVL